MTRRAHIPVKVELAAALLALGDVPYEHAKLMTAEQIRSLYDFHHNIRHAEDGTIHFSNLEPMLRPAHRERTAKIDIPAIAKGKRIRRREGEYRSRVLAKVMGDHDEIRRQADNEIAACFGSQRARPKRKIESRGFGKQHRPLQSANNLRKRT